LKSTSNKLKRSKSINKPQAGVARLHPQYHERQFYYLPYIIFFAVLLVGGWTRAHYIDIITPTLSIIISLIVLVMLAYAFNFQELTIDLNGGIIKFGFGIQYAKVRLESIKSCMPSRIPASKFIGMGIFKGLDGSIAYATHHRGVHIVTDKQEYYISCHNPEILCRLIEEQKTIKKDN
jgi:hypothetical protein